MTDDAPQKTVAEIFWQAAEPPTPEQTAPNVVLHALLALRAFDAGEVRAAGTDNPLRLMSLVAEMGLEEDLVYASPEVVRGESFDVRALVFTIGVLIFERLTDRHPFGTSDNPTRLARLRRGEMGSGVNYLPSVPKDLRTILMRAMGPFPEERYGALAELRGALAEFVSRPDLAVAHDDAERDARPRAGLPARIAALTAPQSKPTRERRPGTGQLARLRERRPPSVESPRVPGHDDPRVAGSPRAHDSPHAIPAADLADVLEPEPTPDSREVAREPASMQMAPSHGPVLAPTRQRAKYAPLMYGIAGAAVASVLFVLLGGGRSGNTGGGASDGGARQERVTPGTGTPRTGTPRTGTPRTVTPPTVTPPTGAPAAAADAAPQKTRADVGPASAAIARPKLAPPQRPPAPAPAPAPATSISEPPGVAAGRRVAAAIEPCKLRRAAGPEMRVSVYLIGKGTKAVRGFVGRLDWMTAAQVRCAKRSLAGLELGVTLGKSGYIEWGLRLRPEGVSVRLRRPKKLPPQP